MKKKFSETLKQLRMNAGYTQKQVYEMIGVPQSTFSSWEVGKSEPSADVLLQLCKIYGVNDILSAFGYDGYNEDGSICLNMNEIDMVEKYRLLDEHGREMVDFTLEKEYERSIELEKKLNEQDDDTIDLIEEKMFREFAQQFEQKKKEKKNDVG